MGQPTKSKSFILTSCLVAVSFAIINCQKAPNKSGVKPTVASPAGTATGKASEVAVEQCSPEAVKAVKKMRELAPDVSKSGEGKSVEEKNALTTKRNEFKSNCEIILKEIEKPKNKACKMDATSKAAETSDEGKKNAITRTEMKEHCDKNDKNIAEDKGETSGTSGVAKTEEQRKKEKEDKDRKDKQDAALAFLRANMQLVTDEIKDMSADNKDSKFKKFLVGGDIKSEKALDLANANKAVICAISGEKIDKSVSKTLTMTFMGNEYTTVKGEDALDGFKGDAMSVQLIRVGDNSEDAMMDGSAMVLSTLTLTCLNMKSTEVNVDKLKAAIGYKGKHIKEITVADLKKLQKDNKDAYDRKVAARTAAQPAAAGGAQPAAGTQPAAAGGGQAVDEKKTLIAAVTAARMELGAQKQKVEKLEERQATALKEVNAAKASLTTAKIDSAEFTDLAKKLREAAEAVAAADDALVAAKKESDQAATKTAEGNLNTAKKALAKLESDSLPKVKAVKTVKAFMEMQMRSSKAIAEQAKIVEELTKEKAKITGFETTLATKIKAALDKGVTKEEVAAPAAASGAA